jgi:hypothetical protein
MAGIAACKPISYTTLSGLLAALLLWAIVTICESENRRARIGLGRAADNASQVTGIDASGSAKARMGQLGAERLTLPAVPSPGFSEFRRRSSNHSIRPPL